VPHPTSSRERLVAAALRLTYITIAWGVGAGSVAIAEGVAKGSLGVVGLGLNVLADVTGSAVLVWRFRSEARDPHRADVLEARAGLVVGVALAVVSLVLTASAIRALAVGSHPGHSTLGLVTAALSITVLAPLAYGKRRVAARLGSHALKGDSTLSAVGAAIAAFALTGLLLDDAFDWWWADRVAALMVAAVAAVESWRVLSASRR
jgi:divalent metal cation (Fe/Co/Zn/Cd) transporter